MRGQQCPDYVGAACIDGRYPIARHEELEYHCIDVINNCNNCFYKLGCEDCYLCKDYCQEKMEDFNE